MGSLNPRATPSLHFSQHSRSITHNLHPQNSLRRHLRRHNNPSDERLRKRTLLRLVRQGWRCCPARSKHDNPGGVSIQMKVRTQVRHACLRTTASEQQSRDQFVVRTGQRQTSRFVRYHNHVVVEQQVFRWQCPRPSL